MKNKSIGFAAFSMITFCAVLMLSWGTLMAQAFDLQFQLDQNDGTVSGNYVITPQIQANGSSFRMGSASLVFTYNTTGMNAPTLTGAANFSGGNYQTMTVTEPVPGRVSINIEFSSTAGNGTLVNTGGYIDICTIQFTILNTAETSDLAWRTASPNPTIVFEDDEASLVPAGNLDSRDDLLPVELAAFSVEQGSGSMVLRWTTHSEINNQGFEVFRSDTREGDYIRLAGYDSHEELRGAGNSNVEQNYRYEDRLISGDTEYWYKIADVDINGVRTFHGPRSINSSDDLIPRKFELLTNYPNPFNPGTTVRYQIPAYCFSIIFHVCKISS